TSDLVTSFIREMIFARFRIPARSLAVALPFGLALVFLASCARSPQKKEAVFLETGRKHLQAKDFERASIDFRNALQVAPKDAEPHYQLGLAYLGAGDLQ